MKTINGYVLLISLLTFSTSGWSQQRFPEIQVFDFDENASAFPKSNSSATLIALVFHKKAQDDLESWLEPVYEQILDETGMGSMIYDGEVRLIIAFTGALKAAKNKAMKKIKASTDRAYDPYLLFYEGDYDPFSLALNSRDKKALHLLVIDGDGNVLEHATGGYSERKFEQLAIHLEY